MACKDKYGRCYVVVSLDRDALRAVEALREEGRSAGRARRRRTHVLGDLIELGLALKAKASAPDRVRA